MVHEMPEEMLFDKRLVERHIRQGLTTREQYDAWLARQPDLATEADVVMLEKPAGSDRSAADSH